MKGSWKTNKPKYRRKEFNTMGRWECTCQRCIGNRLYSDIMRMVEADLEMHEYLGTPLPTRYFGNVPKNLTTTKKSSFW